MSAGCLAAKIFFFKKKKQQKMKNEKILPSPSPLPKKNKNKSKPWTLKGRTPPLRRLIGYGKLATALYFVSSAILACVLQSVRSSMTEQAVQDLVQRLAQMEEHVNTAGQARDGGSPAQGREPCQSCGECSNNPQQELQEYATAPCQLHW